jgi:DNA repair and recombination RAD54-like protein
MNTYTNSPTISSTLSKPFHPPLSKRTSVLPARKKRKTTSYAEDDQSTPDSTSSNDSTFGVNRVVLGGLDINALKSRRRDSGEVFRKTFVVPAKEGENGVLTMERRVGSAPSLGMLRPVNFVPRALHDPAGEFAIVLYDPTIDDEPTPKIQDGILHTQATHGGGGFFGIGANSSYGGGREGGE